MNNPVSTSRGLSLLELIIVICIIGVLTASIIPTLSQSRIKALCAQSKNQFLKYILGLEAYRQSYGHFPHFLYGSKEEPMPLNSTASAFIASLSPSKACIAHPGNDVSLSNPQKIHFCSFAKNELNDTGLIQDAFGNSNIYIAIDSNNDGSVCVDGTTIPVSIAIFSRPSSEHPYMIKSWE